MGKTYETITPKIANWLKEQKIFFVSTAPLSTEGLLNLSPKGMDSFRILGDREVAYLDLTGSGVETIAHLKENGRIVIMFCAFCGPPQIVRFHGRGIVHEEGSPEYEKFLPQFVETPGARAIITIAVDRISDSCGYSIPFYEYQGEREVLKKWATTKKEEGVKAYQAENNRVSLDGLPGLGTEQRK